MLKRSWIDGLSFCDGARFDKVLYLKSVATKRPQDICKRLSIERDINVRFAKTLPLNTQLLRLKIILVLGELELLPGMPNRNDRTSIGAKDAIKFSVDRGKILNIAQHQRAKNHINALVGNEV